MPKMSSVKMESATVTTTTSATTSMSMSTSPTPSTPPPPPPPIQIPATAPVIAASMSATVSTFQLPMNMSTNSMGNAAAAATATATTTTTTTTITRNNISVTNIKCEVDDMVSTTTTVTNGVGSGGGGGAGGSGGDSGVSNIHVPVIATNATSSSTTTTTTIGNYFNGGIGEVGVGVSIGGIRIPVTKTEEDSDSETELTNIENLKVTRRVNAHQNIGGIGGVGGGGGAIIVGGGSADGANGVIIGSAGCTGVLDLHHNSNGDSACNNNSSSNNNANSNNKNGPRPMSWEGELSETETTETELMETENSLSNGAGCGGSVGGGVGGGGGLATITATPPTLLGATPASVITPMALGVAALIKSELHAHTTAASAATTTTTTILAHTQQQQQQQQQLQHHFHATPRGGSVLQAAHAIKSEVEMDVHGIYVSPHSHSHSNNNHHHHHPHNNNNIINSNNNNKLKLAPTQSDPINLKYEPSQSNDAAATATTTTSHNSPLLTRNGNGKCGGGGGATTIATGALPLPANPSPDSAIHSVYTHSSPSQSPLTSRHAPYTPSLSRNNSDASHSSCYSYSSEFSPTHSPIQGRHATPSAAAAAAAAALYNSLHHSVLYRPISLDSGVGGGAGASGAGGPGANGSLLPTPSSSSSSMEAAQNLSTNSSSTASSSSSSGNGSNPNANANQASSSSSPATGGGGGIGVGSDSLPASAAGISRQQLINSPCPICGDKISGFHYGIFSCESCKGFFKRTVQNRKNYVCVRGGPCPVSIATRKKCPACRFEKCLQKGMKLEAIREDRTRGGRSTYQCSYTLPNAMLSPLLSPDHQPMSVVGPGASSGAVPQQTQSPHGGGGGGGGAGVLQHGSALNGYAMASSSNALKCEQNDDSMLGRGNSGVYGATFNGVAAGNTTTTAAPMGVPAIPTLLQEIMNVEHLWQYNEAELARLNQPLAGSGGTSTTSSTTQQHTQQQQQQQQMTNPLLASAGLGENTNPDLIAHLCNVADHRLYKIVKWCKSLPLFKNISIDDQICLLINSWCELLLFSCCFRSVDTPGEIKMSQGKKLSLTQAKSSGLQSCIERMLNLTGHLRRLRVDSYEYVAMKVIVLLQSDTSELREPVKVRECQEKALQSLQAYTLAHYPNMPSKFGELLLRIPELQRTCQLGKEMLTIKSRDGGDFNLLMELLRGEH